MTGEVILHYKIIEKLGEGGMGVVYKAEDLRLKRIVALKFLPHHLTRTQEEQARFRQEAQAAGTLNHPNICTIHAIEEFEGNLFITMEYVEGATLRQKIPLQKVQDALSYAVQIGEALHEAHSKGIVHRDVKADNMMVNNRNQIKVMDFGLAKLKGSVKLTRTSSTVGTLAYMSPEQIAGEEVDARSDVFSFGVLLNEMLTGKTPFRGEHEAAMMYSIVNEEPEPITRHIPDAPPGLLHVLDRALEKNREDRYQTAQDMVIDIRRLIKESTRVTRSFPVQPGAVTPEAKKVSLRSWVHPPRIFVLIAASLIVAGLVLLITRKRGESINPNMTFRVLSIPLTQVYYPGLSPDGNWTAFPAVDAGGTWDIYFMNTAGSEPRRITNDSSALTQGADVSADGNQIVYDLFDLKAQRIRVCVVSSLGGLSRRIADGGFIPRWRPDGARIGFLKNDESLSRSQSGKLEIWSIHPDGSDAKLEFIDSLSSRGRYSLSYSPDGNSVAWIRSFPQGYQEVFTRNLQDGREVQMTFDKKNIDEVCWTRQDEILFSSNKNGNTNLWLVPSTGGQPVQITRGGGPDIGMKISTDGKKLLYLEQQKVGHVWLGSIDGSNARQVTFDDRQINSVSLSPDGNQILFEMGDADPLKPTTSLYLMDRNGADRRKITSGFGVVTSASFSPDGKWISYLTRAAGEPVDSLKAFVLESANPGAPRFVGKGTMVQWSPAGEIVLLSGMKSMLLPLDGPGQKFYEDSTFAIPIPGENVFYQDFREGRAGMWIAPRANPEMRRKVSSLPNAALSPDGALCLEPRTVGEVRAIPLPDGNPTSLKFPGISLESNLGIRSDGKEIVYVDVRISGRLVMIENLH